jgi:hypothetical protein
MQHRKKAAALQAKRQALEPGKDPSYLLRQAIYDTVVSHLESNFLLISHQSMGDIQRKLSQGKRVTRLGIPLPLVGQGNEAASHIPHRAASTSAPDVGTESRHSDDDDDDDYNVPDEGSDAGLSNASPRRDVRAKTSSSTFFDGEASKEEHRYARRAHSPFLYTADLPPDIVSVASPTDSSTYLMSFVNDIMSEILRVGKQPSLVFGSPFSIPVSEKTA